MMYGRWIVLAAVFFATPSVAQSVDPVSGYRMEDYRAPVPDTLEGARVVDDEEAYDLWQSGGVIFVDVFPQPPRPKLPEGTIFRQKPRLSIPGTVWLPNVGYGALADVTDQYFSSQLETATGGDPEKTVLFFCLLDCWMSWNAAKRAVTEYGYTDVIWYPDGTDGWTFMEYPLEEVSPAE